VARAELLERNGLSASAVLRLGMLLTIDAPAAPAAMPPPDGLSAMPE